MRIVPVTLEIEREGGRIWLCAREIQSEKPRGFSLSLSGRASSAIGAVLLHTARDPIADIRELIVHAHLEVSR